MKLKFFIHTIFLSSLLIDCKSKDTTTEKARLNFNNPLPEEFGDPYILKASNGMYYIIGTGGVKDGFKMYSSIDLKEWIDEGRIYQGNTDSSWSVDNFWAA